MRDNFIRPECGTLEGYNIHMRKLEDSCIECKAAYNQFRWDKQHRSDKHSNRKGEWSEFPCGTVQGYQAHHRREDGPVTCEECKAARRAWDRSNRKPRVTIPRELFVLLYEEAPPFVRARVESQLTNKKLEDILKKHAQD